MEQTFSYVMACFKWTKTVRGILVFCLSSVNFLTFISCFLFLLHISCLPFYGISSFLLVSVWAMLKTTVVSILHKEEAVLPCPLPRCRPLLCAALCTVSENSWIKSTLYHFCPINTYLWSFSGQFPCCCQWQGQLKSAPVVSFSCCALWVLDPTPDLCVAMWLL